jgi:1,2-dihydroxy-3-keto-5-methylthiopentene dioxygenase
MSRLRIYADNSANTLLFETHEHPMITEQLNKVGIRFEAWKTDPSLKSGAAAEQVIAAYRPEIDRLMHEKNYQAVDVVSMTPDHPQKNELRQKFLSEHTHSEDEVRFFVSGEGLFSLHIQDKVYEVLCQRGDLIGVPDLTRHWFDMGPNPNFIAIRLFTNPAGWVANFTESRIAEQFSRLEN